MLVMENRWHQGGKMRNFSHKVMNQHLMSISQCAQYLPPINGVKYTM